MLVTPEIRRATLQMLHRSMWLRSMRLAIRARDDLEQGLDEIPAEDISAHEELMEGYRRYTRVLVRF